jgi:PAS domain S-box-containing protein
MNPDLERQLAELRPGNHLCVLYEPEAERLSSLVPYLCDGLARGERCLYAAGEHGSEPVHRALAAIGVDAPAERARGALLSEPAAEVYLRTGSFNPRATRDVWSGAEQQALRAGFVGLRVAADVPVAVGGASELERWIDYEANLNDFLAGSRTLILCQYDLGRFPSRGILPMLQTHPIVVLGRRVCRNPYYELPGLVAAHDADDERVGWMLDQLRRLHDSEHENRALHRATLAISGELDLDARLERVLDAALELTGAEHARIILETPATDDMEFSAVRGALGHMAGYRQPVGVGVTGAVIKQNRPVRIRDAVADPRTWDRETVRHVGIRSWLGVPLADGERPFGVLAVVSEEVDRFSEEDEGRLLSLAALAGSTIREARLRRQLERELDERRRAEEALFRREQELRAVVEAAPDVIIRVDRDLRYVYVNPAFESVMGVPSDAMLGRTIGEMGMARPVADALRLTVRQVFATGRERTVELKVTAAAGDRVLQVRAAPEFGPDGRVEHVVAVARDVTERTRREDEQARLYRELMERDERLQALVRRALLAGEQEQRRLRGLEELEHLTRREREVLRLLAQGLTTRRISEQLVIGTATVKSHVERILAKLGVANRAQATARAVELGLLGEESRTADTADAGSGDEAANALPS